MTWFKVDDNLAFHPKVLAAGNSAMGLWVRAGSWSAQQLTDGEIPDAILPSLGTVKQAEALVRAGLWSRAAASWSFHEWSADGRQPTREAVEAERAASRARQRKHRAERDMSPRESRVTNAVSHADVTPVVTDAPTRPDPTRPKENASHSLAKKREVRIPSDWSPTKEHIDRAKESGVDVVREADSFRLHAETHDRHAASWNAAFTTWLKKAKPTVNATMPRGIAKNDEWMWR